MGLTYYRIDGEGLDPRRSVESAWVGTERNGSGEQSVDGKGAPIVGVAGATGENHVFALGLVYGRRPPVKVADPPPTKKEPAERPKEPVEPEPKPAEPPGTQPRKAQTPVAATEEPKKPPEEGMNWLPLAVFGLVSIAVALPLFLVLRSRKGPASTPPLPPAGKLEALDVLPVLSADDGSEGIRATLPSPPRPSAGLGQEPPSAKNGN